MSCVRHFEYCVCVLWSLWNASSKFMRVFEFFIVSVGIFGESVQMFSANVQMFSACIG